MRGVVYVYVVPIAIGSVPFAGGYYDLCADKLRIFTDTESRRAVHDGTHVLDLVLVVSVFEVVVWWLVDVLLAYLIGLIEKLNQGAGGDVQNYISVLEWV